MNEAAEKYIASHLFEKREKDFEHASLKGDGGLYEDVFTGLSYGDYSVSQAAERLCAGIQAALAGETP